MIVVDPEVDAKLVSVEVAVETADVLVNLVVVSSKFRVGVVAETVVCVEVVTVDALVDSDEVDDIVDVLVDTIEAVVDKVVGRVDVLMNTVEGEVGLVDVIVDIVDFCT